MKHLLHYLKDKIDLRILYSVNRENLTVFTNVVYVNAHKFKLITGFLALILNDSVIWTSHKQMITAQSIIKSEYMALADAVKQAIWLHHLLHVMRKSEIYEKKMTTIYENNKDSLNLTVNLVFHSWIKHIQIWYHAIQNYIERGKIQLQYIQTDEMLANSLIKSLDWVKFEQMIKKLGLTNW